MTTRGLSYRRVRRRQVGAFATMIAAVVVLCVGIPMLSPEVGGIGASVLLAGFLAVMLGAFVVAIRARTVAARHVLQTGELPDLPDPTFLRRELEGIRAQYAVALLVAASVVVLMPLGAASAHVTGTAVVPVLSWTTAVMGVAVVLAAFWARWLWRRRTNVADVLQELGRPTS